MIPKGLPGVKDSDIISGSCYNSLVKAYKEHNESVQRLLNKLFAENKRLLLEVNTLKQYNSELQEQFNSLLPDNDDRYKRIKKLCGTLSKRLCEARAELSLLKK